MVFDFLAEADFSSIFSLASLQVVVALIVIEGLLSVDNALAIAALASHLDEKKRKLAVTIGYAGAYGFRILALFLASYIINNHWLMAFGAGYLIWLMCNHFAENEDYDEHEGKFRSPPSFAKTIALIAFLDLSLSFDNVVAAVAFARDSIVLVYVGVTIGIITLRLVAGYCMKLLEKHPWLEHTAFLLVGFVGALLCTELLWDAYVRRDLVLLGYEFIHGEESVDITGADELIASGGAPIADAENKALHYHIKKPIKFGGIFLIVLGHLTYEKYPAVKSVFLPVAMAIRSVFAIIARTINSLFRLAIWPIRILVRSLLRKPESQSSRDSQ
jgi:YkoY family integral membrane protein